MFASGYLPGLLMCVSLMLLVGYLARKRKYPCQRTHIAPFKAIIKCFLDSLWALGLPVLLIVGLRMGIFSATEGGAICCLYSLVVGALVYKSIKLEHMLPIIRDAVLSSCTVMIISCAANIFSYFLSWETIPQKLATLLGASVSSGTVMMLLVVLLFLIIGMFMDGTAAMIVIAPILAPVAKSLGMDMVYFGLVMVMCCAVGAITPPFGAIIYLVAPMMRMRVSDFIKELIPFIVVLILDILIVVLIPQIATFLPNLIYG